MTTLVWRRASAFALVAVLLAAPTSARQLAEVVTAIQVRGNVATSDEDVSRMAGLSLGMPVGADTVTAAAERLRASKRFDTVDVLKRYASLTDPAQIVIVVIVDEGAVSIERTSDPDHPIRVVRSRWPRLLVAPILGTSSGYGPTYGIRVTHPDPIGRDSRISFPASWGGQKEIGAEIEKRFAATWLTRVEGGGALTRTTNPYFEVDDDRKAVWLAAERQFTSTVRVRATAGWQLVLFRDVADRAADVGVEVVFDTRLDPFLARNAVFVRAKESRLAFEHLDDVNRTDVEAHGYLGLIGQAILVASARTDTASGSLPDYLKPLLGGPSSVRGFRTGTSTGDSLAAGSLELRVPLTSPLSIGKVGVSAFVDAGTVADSRQRLGDQSLARGAGGGIWFAATVVRVNVEVAHGVGASTRVHVSGNLTF